MTYTVLFKLCQILKSNTLLLSKYTVKIHFQKFLTKVESTYCWIKP